MNHNIRTLTMETKKVKDVTPPSSAMLLDLFSRYNRALKIFVKNTVKCEQAAHEITQETYARLAAVQNQKKIDYPRAYLFQTAKNISLDFLRRKGLRVFDETVEVHSEMAVSLSPNPEEILVHKQAKQEFENALKELPLRTRQVFYFRRYENLSIKQVAAKLGISERLVYKQMEDTMRHLAVRLKGEK